MTGTLVAAANPVAAIGFRAETNPEGPVIDLVWDLPDPTGPVDDPPVRIVRRQRRFPGRGRRGVLPVAATATDLSDGRLVYDSGTFAFALEETTDELLDGARVSTSRQYRWEGTPPDRSLARTVRRAAGPGQRPPRTTIRVTDREGLQPGTVYYYTAFVGSPPFYSAQGQAAALATAPPRSSLFATMPGVDQRLDTVHPPPAAVARADADKGQLQRFVEVVDLHAAMLAGMVDGLRALHDPRRIDSRLLPRLAHLLGWRLKDYLDEDGQRTELRYAPEFYRTVGTSPNVATMINRLTGWDAQVREFARSIARTFNVARLEALNAATVYLDGSLTAHPGETPPLRGRRVPVGTADTADTAAMFKLRTHAVDDPTAYTYDCGRPDGRGGWQRDDTTWYDRATIGVYIVPDVETEPFTLQTEWERIRQIIGEFLPIQVRAVFVLQPTVVVEEAYDATAAVTDDLVATVGVLGQAERGDAAQERGVDLIPAWRWLMSNDLGSRTVDVTTLPVDTGGRTRHVGVGVER
jgi:phage tail-like protein